MFGKKERKDITGLMTAGIGLGVAQSLTTSDISPLTSKMPVIGNVMGAGLVMGELDKLNKKIKRL